MIAPGGAVALAQQASSPAQVEQRLRPAPAQPSVGAPIQVPAAPAAPAPAGGETVRFTPLGRGFRRRHGPARGAVAGAGRPLCRPSRIPGRGQRPGGAGHGRLPRGRLHPGAGRGPAPAVRRRQAHGEDHRGLHRHRSDPGQSRRRRAAARGLRPAHQGGPAADPPGAGTRAAAGQRPDRPWRAQRADPLGRQARRGGPDPGGHPQEGRGLRRGRQTGDRNTSARSRSWAACSSTTPWAPAAGWG
ncbi:MAG: hypothetical protein WDN45_10205 [Caulobacteraceae bacterium]